jgi:hypothetical protein
MPRLVKLFDEAKRPDEAFIDMINTLSYEDA